MDLLTKLSTAGMLIAHRVEAERRLKEQASMRECTFKPQLSTLHKQTLENRIGLRTATHAMYHNSPLKFGGPDNDIECRHPNAKLRLFSKECRRATDKMKSFEEPDDS